MHTRARGVPQDVDPAFFARIATANAPTSVDTGYNARPVNRETAGPFSATIYRGAARVGQAPEISVAPNPAAFSGFSATRRYTSEEHLKAHTGRGGTSNAEAAAAAAAALAARGAAVPPPRAGASRPRPNPPNTELRRAYERSDLPLIVAAGSKHALVWKVPVASLDFHHYLPVFASGLREVEEPYRFIAEAGFDALLAGGGEDKVLPVIPQLIVPLKDALATRDERVVVRTMKAVAALAKLGPRAGAALVPYYRQLLPVASLMGNRALNIGDAMDYGQRRGHVGDTIVAALEALEAAGGPDAYINIKYVVPWYESSC